MVTRSILPPLTFIIWIEMQFFNSISTHLAERKNFLKMREKAKGASGQTTSSLKEECSQQVVTISLQKTFMENLFSKQLKR